MAQVNTGATGIHELCYCSSTHLEEDDVVVTCPSAATTDSTWHIVFVTSLRDVQLAIIFRGVDVDDALMALLTGIPCQQSHEGLQP